MKCEISYERLETVEALKINNNVKRNPAKGEKLTFIGFYSIRMRGIMWNAAIFNAADGVTQVDIPLSKLPNWQRLQVGQYYYVTELTRHYVLISSRY